MNMNQTGVEKAMNYLDQICNKKSELPANSLKIEPAYKDLQVMCKYRRLRFTRRFNNLPTITTEDVAQHSFFTTILARTMAEEYNEAVQRHNLQVHPYDVDNAWDKVNVDQVTVQALYHDIEESFTSDIPWNVKHHNEEVNTAIKHATWDKLKAIYKGCSPIVEKQMSTNISAKLGLEGKFVAVADMMECAWECHQEEHLGNKYLQSMKLKAIQEINEMEFSKVLYDTSPLFKSMMKMFEGRTARIACDEMELD